MEGYKLISLFNLNTIGLTILIIVVVLTFVLTYLLFSIRANRKMNAFLLNSLIHEQDQYILFFDFNSKLVLANKRFEDLVGLSDKKMGKKKFAELPIQKDIIDTFLKHNDDLLSGRSSSIVYNSSFERRENKEWFQIQKRILTIPNSKAKYILTEATDFSDRKLVEERLSDTQNEYRQLVEFASDIIFKVDLRGNFNFVNSVVKETLGYSETEFLSMNFKDLVIEEDYDRVNQFYIKQVKDNTPSTYIEFRVKTKNNVIKWLGQSITFITQQEKVVGFQSVTRDITAAKEAEEHLKRAKEIAEETSRTKTGFIASMSHEFRTPLNAILGYTQILSQSGSLNQIEKEHVKTVSNAGEQLLGMVTDILELSTLDSDRSKLDNELVALPAFMNSLASHYENKAIQEGLKFSFTSTGEVPEIIEVDVDKISSIVKNLLSNAIKFTPKGTVGLSYYISKIKERDSLVLEIKDTGIGISDETKKNIFLPFWQLDSLKNNGTGLGLTLCKRLVEFLDGEISLKSKIGKGTIVKIEIPITISKQTDFKSNIAYLNVSNQDILSNSQKTKVLIVDDLEPNRTITRLILKENGYEIQEAEDGNEAIKLLTTFNPDIILMDINMPIMDGLEAMLTIRASNENYSKIPIVAVTAGGFKGDRNELIAQGFSDYILKPFKTDELLGSINRFVGKKEVVQESKVEEIVDLDSIAKFVNSLSDEKKVKIKRALKMQDLDFLSKISEDPNFKEDFTNPNMKALTNAALDYDYLYLTKVLKAIDTL